MSWLSKFLLALCLVTARNQVGPYIFHFIAVFKLLVAEVMLNRPFHHKCGYAKDNHKQFNNYIADEN